MTVAVLLQTADSVRVVNSGPQIGPITPLYSGGIVQTPKGIYIFYLGFHDYHYQSNHVGLILSCIFLFYGWVISIFYPPASCNNEIEIGTCHRVYGKVK